tara:strand:- start:481 stop:645 length:165 start_codon:yes stop_codon:yes gene_type:complete
LYKWKPLKAIDTGTKDIFHTAENSARTFRELKTGGDAAMAEGMGFEPTIRLKTV